MRRAFRYEVTESDVKILTPASLDYVSRTVPVVRQNFSRRAGLDTHSTKTVEIIQSRRYGHKHFSRAKVDTGSVEFEQRAILRSHLIVSSPALGFLLFDRRRFSLECSSVLAL